MTDDLLYFNELDFAHQAGKDNVLAELLSRLKLKDEGSLAVELAAADLEWHWRRAIVRASWEQRTENMPPCVTQHQLDLLSAAGIEFTDNQRVELCKAEWFAWNCWGVPPSIDKFLETYELSTDHRWEFVMMLDEITRWGVNLAAGQQSLPFTPVFNDRLVMGRQRGSDAPPLSFNRSEHKLVIAPSNQAKISRQQLMVERISFNQLRITNLSQNRCRISSSTSLATGQSVEAAMPLRLVVDQTRIEIGLEEK